MSARYSDFRFTEGWQHGRGHELLESERIAELNRPVPHNLNAPELFKATKVRVLKPFCVGGESLEIGATVELQAHDAHSLAAIGKCEILN
jgi:hypothetical protein